MSTVLTARQGGTGASSLTGVILGNGTSAFTAVAIAGTGTKYLDDTGAFSTPANAGVTSFNTRSGAVTLTSGDVTAALGFTPYNSTNPAGYTTNTGTVTSVATDATLTGGPITATGTLGINLGNSNFFTIQQGINISSLGATTSSGLLVENTTTAALAAQQWSPSITWTGQGWATGVNNSQSVSFQAYVIPTQAATSPGGTWELASMINGGALTNIFSVSSAGTGIFAGNLAGNGSFQTSGTAIISNLFIASNAGNLTQSAAQYQYAGSTNNNIRSAFYGSSASSVGIGNNYSSVIFSSAPITTPTTGTNVWVSNIVMNPLGTITISGTTPTNTATLYIGGANAQGTNNYAIYVASGNSSFQGAINATGNVTAATMVVGSGQAYTGGGNDQAFNLQTRSFTAANTAVTAITGTVTNSTGQFVGFAIKPTYNQTSTASATDFLINRTQTAIGSGTQYLADFQVGSSSLLSINNLGQIIQHSTASAQGIVFYNTVDEVTNVEKQLIQFNSNIFTIYGSSLGTGSLRESRFGDGADYFSSNGAASLGNPKFAAVRTGDSTASLFNITTSGNFTASTSIIQYGLQIKFGVNQTSTAGYTGLLINATETGTGSGTKLLADLQIAGVSKFNINNVGAMSTAALTGVLTVGVGGSFTTTFNFNTPTANRTVTFTDGTYTVVGTVSTQTLTNKTIGDKIRITTGSNASAGVATLVGGTVTVSTTAVTASSLIYLTDATTGTLTNIGTPTVGTIVAGTSFVINSSNILDTSNINWLIIN